MLRGVYRTVTIVFPVTKARQPIDSFRERLAAFACELTAVEQGSVGALHRTRVASRRLRELLALMSLDRESSRTLTRPLRKVTQRLGAVRELDVLVGLIDEFERSGRYSPSVMATLRRAVEQRRAAARDRLAAKLPTSKLERLVNRLQRASEAATSIDAADGDAARRACSSVEARLAAARWALARRSTRRALRAGTASRRPHRAQEAALRGGARAAGATSTIARRRRRSQSRAGAARPLARLRGPHRGGTRPAGLAASARPRHLARTETTGSRPRGRLPADARPLHAGPISIDRDCESLWRWPRARRPIRRVGHLIVVCVEQRAPACRSRTTRRRQR